MTQTLSDTVDSSYLRGEGGDGFILGKQLTSGFVSPKNVGYTTEDPKDIMTVSVYARDVKNKIKANGVDYNNFTGDKDFNKNIFYSSAILGGLNTLSTATPATKKCFWIRFDSRKYFKIHKKC